MNGRVRWRSAAGLMMVYGLLSAQPVFSHSASDAYLTLTVEPGGSPNTRVLHGQWDIALRDLDFVMKLDDGDGRLTWGEVRQHQGAIEHYAYQFLKFGDAAHPCTLKSDRQLIDDHADGAYAALFFTATCTHAPTKLALQYTLFFAIDPSHRGIFVLQNAGAIATALLSPQNARIDLAF